MLIAGLLALLSFLASSCSGQFVVHSSSTRRSGAVSSESKVCSEIGIELLKQGVSGPVQSSQLQRLIA